MDNVYNIQLAEAMKMQELKYHVMINYICDRYKYTDYLELGQRSDLIIGTIMPSFTGFVRRGRQEPHNLTFNNSYQFLDENRDVITRPILFDKLNTIL